jgi:hypothetical protein
MRHCMCVIEINQCQFSQVRADTNIHKIISVVASFAASLEGPRNYQLVIGKFDVGCSKRVILELTCLLICSRIELELNEKLPNIVE